MSSFLMVNGIYLLRILIAAACGAAIGEERENRERTAGLRTHIIIAIASCMMMILSKYAFSDVLGDTVMLDPSRIAAGVVSSIGFLGTGIIFVQRKEVVGLTTAAGLWATVGIGMGIGAGMYFISICVTGMVVLVQVRLRKHRVKLQPHDITRINLHLKDDDLKQAIDQLSERKIEVVGMSVMRTEEPGVIDAVLSVLYPQDFSTEDVIELMKAIPSVTSVED
jgi:putative Mg2+ transporter-C (MgtC) family protein